MKKLITTFIFSSVLGLFSSTFSAESGKIISVQPRRIVVGQSAGLLPKGFFEFDFGTYQNGGFATGFAVGVTNRLNLGFSVTSDSLLGEGNPQLPPKRLTILAKYRIAEESYALPALALGYDGRSFSEYLDRDKRFYYKAPGLFLVGSKNFLILGYPLGLHAGLNYNLEDRDTSNTGWPDLELGIDKSINDELAVVAEYDCGMNEWNRNPLDGFLHLGIRWNIVPELGLEFDWKDILRNKESLGAVASGLIHHGSTRELRIVYINNF